MLKHCILGLAILAAGTAANAQSEMAVPYRVVNTSAGAITSSGAQVRAGLAGVNAANNAVYTSRVVNISRSSLGVLAKARSFTPYGLAITAALAAYNYHQENGEIVTPGDMPVPTGSTFQCIHYNTPSGDVGNFQYNGQTWAECMSHFADDPDWPETFTDANATGRWVYGRHPNNRPIFLIIATDQDVIDQYDGLDPSNWKSNPVSDEDVYDALFNPNTSKFSRGWRQSLTNSLMNDPATGRPRTDVQEMNDAATDATTDLETRTATGVDPAPESELDPGTEGMTEVDTATGEATDVATGEETAQPPEEIVNPQPEPDLAEPEYAPSSQSEEGTDPCLETNDLVSCLETGNELDPEDLDVLEPAISLSPISLTSNAVCPAPPTFTAQGQTLEFSNEPLCNFATAINPLVVLMGAIVSMFIVAGAVRQ